MNYPTRFDSTATQKIARQGRASACRRSRTTRGGCGTTGSATSTRTSRSTAACAGAVQAARSSSSPAARPASARPRRSASPRPGARSWSWRATRTSSRRSARRSHDSGGYVKTYSCDITDLAANDKLAKDILKEFGHVDVLVNNAGRSIRRSLALSYDRFHDFERTMQLNYFACVRLTMNLLPSMTAREDGPRHQRLLDRRADQRAAVLGLRRVEGRARVVRALRGRRSSTTKACTSRSSTCRWCARR